MRCRLNGWWPEELQADGEFCALGVVGNARGLDMSSIDPDDSEQVSEKFGLADAMVREIVYENDEHRIYGLREDGTTGWRKENPEERWTRMRAWVEKQINRAEP